MKPVANRLSFCILLVLLFVINATIRAQEPVDSTIKWQSIEQVRELMKTKPRPIMVVFYKPGEDSSMLMLNTTLSRKEICTYINYRFYAIKIDGCSDSSITFFDNKTYARQEGKPYNDLVTKLLGEKPVLPSLLFYNKETAGFTFKGFQGRYQLLCMLVYFSEEIEKTTPYEFWSSAYMKAYPPAVAPKAPEMLIHWYSLDEAQALNKQNPKGIFLNWYTKWSAGSTVMLYNAFENPKVAEYMNEHFYCVRLDAQTTDTLIWQTPYYNENKTGHFHQLALAQLQGKMKFPALLFFDKQNNLVTQQQFYLGAVNFFALANYVATDSYKTIKLQEFIKTFKPEW